MAGQEVPEPRREEVADDAGTVGDGDDAPLDLGLDEEPTGAEATLCPCWQCAPLTRFPGR